MADNCIQCQQPVTAKQQGIQCDGCFKWNHRTCNTGKWKLPYCTSFITAEDPSSQYLLDEIVAQLTFFFRRYFSTRISRCCARRCRDRLVLSILSRGLKLENLHDRVISRHSRVRRVQPSFERFVRGPIDDLRSPGTASNWRVQWGIRMRRSWNYTKLVVFKHYFKLRFSLVKCIFW